MFTPLSFSEPALTVTEPVPVPTTPPSTIEPEPALVMPNVSPETSPFNVRVPPLTVIVRAPVRVTAPVFWVRLAAPRKVRSAPKVTALEMVALTEASSVLAPPIVNVPGVEPAPPKALFATPRMSVPADSVVPPV